MEETKVPVTSVDAPSSWSIEEGPPSSGVGSKFNPAVLISLSAPKPLVKHFKGRHFIGGRSVPRQLLPLSVSKGSSDTNLGYLGTGSSRRQSRRSMSSRFRSMKALTRSSRLGQVDRNSNCCRRWVGPAWSLQLLRRMRSLLLFRFSSCRHFTAFNSPNAK